MESFAFWALLGFFMGSIPFSVWLGRLLLCADIRTYGDGNPGSANAWRAGKWRVGVPAVLLDYLKGAVPVSLAHYVFRVADWGLVAVALAPVLGHAFSPFLRFRGGKALTVTFGIWTGMTFAEGPIVLGLLFGFFLVVQREDAWAVLLGMLTFLFYWWLRQADTRILVTCVGNTLVLAYKHRYELRQAPHPGTRILNLLRRGR